MVALPIVLIGRSLSCWTVRVVALVRTSYSNCEIFAVPEGSTRYCAATAVRTSAGESPFACSRAGLKLIITWRCLPPYGYGTTAPGTVTNWVRRKFRPRSLSCCSDNPCAARQQSWPASDTWDGRFGRPKGGRSPTVGRPNRRRGFHPLLGSQRVCGQHRN